MSSTGIKKQREVTPLARLSFAFFLTTFRKRIIRIPGDTSGLRATVRARVSRFSSFSLASSRRDGFLSRAWPTETRLCFYSRSRAHERGAEHGKNRLDALVAVTSFLPLAVASLDGSAAILKRAIKSRAATSANRRPARRPAGSP